MRKIIFKIVIALLLISLAVGVSLIWKYKVIGQTETAGNIAITIKDLSGREETKEVLFKEGDMLIDVLDREYDIRYEDSKYGVKLYDIEWIKTDFQTTYIAIYIDNSYSTLGVSSITLKDGLTIQLVETKL